MKLQKDFKQQQWKTKNRPKCSGPRWVFFIFLFFSLLNDYLKLVYKYYHNQMTQQWWVRDMKVVQRDQMTGWQEESAGMGKGTRHIANASWAWWWRKWQERGEEKREAQETLGVFFFFTGCNTHKKGPKYFFSWLTNFIIGFYFILQWPPFLKGGGVYFKYKRDHQKRAVTMPNDDNHRLMLMFFFIWNVFSRAINKINCMK